MRPSRFLHSDSHNMASNRSEIQQAHAKLEQIRATSASKEYFPTGLEGTSLEQAPELKAAFDPAAKGEPGQDPSSQEREDRAPEHSPTPAPEPRAPGATGAAAQREAFEQRQQNVDDYYTGLAKANESRQPSETEPERESQVRDHDREFD